MLLTAVSLLLHARMMQQALPQARSDRTLRLIRIAVAQGVVTHEPADALGVTTRPGESAATHTTLDSSDSGVNDVSANAGEHSSPARTDSHPRLDHSSSHDGSASASAAHRERDIPAWLKHSEGPIEVSSSHSEAGGAPFSSSSSGDSGSRSASPATQEVSDAVPVTTSLTPRREASTMPLRTYTPSPLPTEESESAFEVDTSMCASERDVGLIDAIAASPVRLCAAPKRATDAGADRSEVSLYSARGGIRATVLTNVRFDMTSANVSQPIQDLSEDGGDHDPRFRYSSGMVQCTCSELEAFARVHGGAYTQRQRMWSSVFPGVGSEDDPDAPLCASPLDAQAAPSAIAESSDGSQSSSRDAAVAADTVDFFGPVIVIARRDDHNPFFQVSSALNAWVVSQALRWDVAKTTVLHLDGGYPSAVDELHQRLLSTPAHALVKGQELVGKIARFHSSVLLAPSESSGPMMQHLDDDEPCGKSELFQTFRSRALAVMGVNDTRPPSTRSGASAAPVAVTIISRRSYSGRKVQRIWVNEDAIVTAMRREYKDMSVVFQSVDFVELSMAQQMATIVQSDVVIGMHGAGMANVLWTRPETLVVEIFPHHRYRWGYRNLCQFVGCDWHEFRGGTDRGVGRDVNAHDKVLEYTEWRRFFDKRFRKRYNTVMDERRRTRSGATSLMLS